MSTSAHDLHILAEDVQWLLDNGEHPDHVAARFGVRRDSIVTRLRRNGIHDLADRMEARR